MGIISALNIVFAAFGARFCYEPFNSKYLFANLDSSIQVVDIAFKTVDIFFAAFFEAGDVGAMGVRIAISFLYITIRVKHAFNFSFSSYWVLKVNMFLNGLGIAAALGALIACITEDVNQYPYYIVLVAPISIKLMLLGFDTVLKNYSLKTLKDIKGQTDFFRYHFVINYIA